MVNRFDPQKAAELFGEYGKKFKELSGKKPNELDKTKKIFYGIEKNNEKLKKINSKLKSKLEKIITRFKK